MKHEAIAECFKSYKARTASFFERLKKQTPLQANSRIKFENLCFRSGGNWKRKVNVFLSHIKTRHGYDIPMYFPREFLMSFLR